MASLAGRRVLLAVSGSIAAYKAVYVARELGRRGAEVRVLMTDAATHFVGPLTFEAITGHPVEVESFHTGSDGAIRHVTLAREADLLVAAPATADLIARLALGLAGDVPTALALVCQAPLLVAPAMNHDMWKHPATQTHVQTLRERGATIVEPGSGFLACGEEGPGRLADPDAIVDAATDLLGAPGMTGPLDGVRVVVTAGGTEAAIDPVRVVANRSSGRMGFALAAGARSLGADVRLIAARTSVPPPDGVPIRPARTVDALRETLADEMVEADVLLMAAAVSDYVPTAPSDTKIKRDGSDLRVDLSPAPDLLAEIGSRRRDGQFLVGFALETTGGEARALEKLRRKGVDLVVLNHPETSLDTETAEVVILDGSGGRWPVPEGSKDVVAEAILNRVVMATGRGT